MNKRWSRHVVLRALQTERFKPALILLVAPLLLVSWKYFGSASYWRGVLAPRLGLEEDPAWAALYSFLCAFVLLGLVPLGIVKFVFREPLASYGVQLGVPGRTLRSVLRLAPVFVLVGYIASLDPEVFAYYRARLPATPTPASFAVHAAGYLLMYLGWEFFFRGFMQFGLRGAMGDVEAVLVQVLASTLTHLGEPVSEAYGAIPGGLLWGALAFHTRSLVSGLVQHFLLGVSLDLFICWRSTGA
ncbi:MAG: CPBP family intramembrane glutamic endopeptidase [Thermoguttaceae bacterium]